MEFVVDTNELHLNSIKVLVKKINENARIPTNGSAKSAGFDLYATSDYAIAPGEVVKVGTGLTFEIISEVPVFGAIFARSGCAVKKGLRPANGVGVCDSDYRGEYIVPLYNDSSKTQIIHKGDRIAQIIFLPCLIPTFEEVENLSETERGEGGFGHSGC